MGTYLQGPCSSTAAGQRQGDQIGRIFAYWMVVYFGPLLKITKCSQRNVGFFLSTVQVMYQY
jgi:hypothetical protein